MKKDKNIKVAKSGIVAGAYKALCDDIKSILNNAQYRAYKAVDNIRVQTYWQVGERIVREELRHKDRADYGRKLILELAKDLGITRALLFEIVQFFRTYPIVHTLCGQLSWSHYGVLIRVSKNIVREFYEDQTLQNNWSVRELERQIKTGLYERVRQKGKLVARRQPRAALPEKIFKDTYNFDFLKIEDTGSEKTVEDALVRNVESLLLEFGRDFSLAGRQRKIIIDNQAHFIDLEFYHRGIPCIVIADIKIGRFKSAYVGQMNKYLNYYRERRKYRWEKDPIGLIVCEYKGEEEVHFALGGLEDKIFVAEYKAKLPTEKEIKTKWSEAKSLPAGRQASSEG